MRFLSLIQCIGGLLTGVGIGLNWTCFQSYVGKCSDSKNRGRFNGFFWNFVMLAFFIAEACSGLVIGTGGYLTFFSVVPFVTVIGGMLLLGLPEPEPIEIVAD